MRKAPMSTNATTQTADTEVEYANGSTYTNVSWGEFRQKFDDVFAAEEVDIEGVNERVMEIQTPDPDNRLVIRVYTTIVGQNSRGHGQDAIRCHVYDTEQGEVVYGETKTLRIAPTKSNPEGWWGNLRPKVTKILVNWDWFKHGDCPECGSVLVERHPGRGDNYDPFIGCSNYHPSDYRGCPENFSRPLKRDKYTI